MRITRMVLLWRLRDIKSMSTAMRRRRRRIQGLLPFNPVQVTFQKSELSLVLHKILADKALHSLTWNVLSLHRAQAYTLDSMHWLHWPPFRVLQPQSLGKRCLLFLKLSHSSSCSFQLEAWKDYRHWINFKGIWGINIKSLSHSKFF